MDGDSPLGRVRLCGPTVLQRHKSSPEARSACASHLGVFRRRPKVSSTGVGQQLDPDRASTNTFPQIATPYTFTQSGKQRHIRSPVRPKALTPRLKQRHIPSPTTPARRTRNARSSHLKLSKSLSLLMNPAPQVFQPLQAVHLIQQLQPFGRATRAERVVGCNALTDLSFR